MHISLPFSFPPNALRCHFSVQFVLGIETSLVNRYVLRTGFLFVYLFIYFFTFYHLPPGFLSLRKEESLPELSPQTPVSGYSWPRRTQVVDKSVSPSCFRSSVPSCPISWCPLCHFFVHLLSLNRAMCPAHPRIPLLITSMTSFTPVWCRIHVLRLWSREVMPSMMRSASPSCPHGTTVSRTAQNGAWCAPFCTLRLTVVPCEPSSVPMSHCRTPWLVTRIHCVPSSLRSY